MKKLYTVAVLGATGAVGQEMIKILQERDFPVGKLIPLASARSAGKTLKFKGEDVTIQLDATMGFAIGECVDYLVEAAKGHAMGYALLTGNAIYVDAPDVETVNTKTELGIMDLMMMLMSGFESLYPSDNGDEYIKEQILNSLELVYTGLWGDANGDGKVLANDAMLVLQYSVGDITADQLNLAVCDVNGDGKVLANDAMLILQFSVGDIVKFPVEQ